MQYDDGYVAWLNGVEIARRNAPATLAYNSTAPAARSKAAGFTVEEIELSDVAGLLHSGTNILAIQGLANVKNGSEFLVLPGVAPNPDSFPIHYMLAPTPGNPQ